MPQIAVVPVKHWNFRVIPAFIDIGRILQEALESGASVVRVTAKFIRGPKPYLFVRLDSDDAKALSMTATQHRGNLKTTNGANVKYTPIGFYFYPECNPDELRWLVIMGEHSVSLALHEIYHQRELLKRRQRVTVECL